MIPPMPDPDQVKESLFRLQDAFRDAADKSTGSARPLFVELSNSFNKAVSEITPLIDGGADINDAMQRAMPSLVDMQMTMLQIQFMALTDAKTGTIMNGLRGVFSDEIEKLTGGVSFGTPQLPPPTPPRRPNKPGNDDFDL